MALSVLYLVTHRAHSLSLPVRGKETEACRVKRLHDWKRAEMEPESKTSEAWSRVFLLCQTSFLSAGRSTLIVLAGFNKSAGYGGKAWTLELNLHLNSYLLFTSKSLSCKTAMSLLGLDPSVIYWIKVQHPCLVWEAGPGGSQLC